jgi:hypothetical protein
MSQGREMFASSIAARREQLPTTEVWQMPSPGLCVLTVTGDVMAYLSHWRFPLSFHDVIARAIWGAGDRFSRPLKESVGKLLSVVLCVTSVSLW